MVEKSGYEYQFHPKGIQNLSIGIIKSAVQEYQQCMRDIEKGNHVPTLMEKIRQLEKFFRSDWYKMLTNVDGEYMIRKIQSDYHARKHLKKGNKVNLKVSDF